MRSLIILYLSVPSPEVMVSPSQSELVSGSTLTLTCSISQSISVTTPTNVTFSWTPNSGTVNATSVELVISSVETADSGDYICSATLTDTSGSSYILDSPSGNGTIYIAVSKCVIGCVHLCVHTRAYVHNIMYYNYAVYM